MDLEAEKRAAISRAERRYASRRFRAAYIDGAHAALDGYAASVCPYEGAGQGWRAWRVAWQSGHRSVTG